MYTIVISNIYQFTSYFQFLKKQVMEKLIGKTSWLMTKRCDFSQPDSNDVVKVEYRWRKKLKKLFGKKHLKTMFQTFSFWDQDGTFEEVNHDIINYSIIITSHISCRTQKKVGQQKGRAYSRHCLAQGYLPRGLSPKG